LSLDSFLFEQDAERRTYPNFLALRIFVLLTLGACTMFLCNLFLIMLPIVMGRFLVSQLVPYSISDIYCFVVGFLMFCGFVILLRMVITSLIQSNVMDIIRLVSSISIIAFKWTFVLSLWLIVIPILLGLLLELAILIPIRTQFNESPYFFHYHDWAFGLLFLKFWFRLVMTEALHSPWKEKFDKVKNDGIAGIDVKFVLEKIISPILLPITTLLCTPCVISRGVLPFIVSSYQIRALVFRYSYLLSLSFIVTYKVVSSIYNWYPRFRQAIIDDKYLIGHKLNNYSESRSQKRTISDQTTTELVH